MPLRVCLTLSAWNSLLLPCGGQCISVHSSKPSSDISKETILHLQRWLTASFCLPLDFVHTSAPFLVSVTAPWEQLVDLRSQDLLRKKL